MFHGSTSDEATMGAYQRMRQPRTSNACKQELRMLVVGGSEEDFASLRELLAGTGNGPLRLEHATSPEDVLNQLGKGSYDLLLCSNQSTDNVAFQVLRQVRQHVSGVPLIFLSGSRQHGRDRGCHSNHRWSPCSPEPISGRARNSCQRL